MTADSKRIILALDFETREACMALLEQLDPAQCRVKVGKEMFTRFGPGWVEALQVMGFDVFLDLKFHDIPNTVARAVSAAADLGVWMVNVHASGGRRMLTAAAEALAGRQTRPLLTAVTILTSLADEELKEIGYVEGAAGMVPRLAGLTRDCGLDGIVCSAQEAPMLREQGFDFTLVTPGIRPEWSAAGDQTRIVTPAEAIRQGSDYLVIGRPITQAKDPSAALARVQSELQGL
ncbi:MAG: orotidine-5'-phosphate decarboxylase [Gammaproteobacteria bacterium]|nr:MAG: orotidine-5'-phosphate decarboxylase [Gammaproteobacteria bacterium]